MTRTDWFVILTSLAIAAGIIAYVLGLKTGYTQGRLTCPAGAVSSEHRETGEVWCYYTYGSTYGQALLKVKGKRS